MVISNTITYNRKTIKSSGAIEGKGLHSGKKCKLVFYPAEEGSGICFYSTVAGVGYKLPATVDFVVDTAFAVVLGNNHISIQTIEHLMFALYVLGITDILIEFQGGKELPVLDGSARPFIDFLQNLSIVEYNTFVEPLKIDEPVLVSDGSRYLLAYPSDNFKISYSIDYPHKLLRTLSIDLDYDSYFFEEKVARARTFGFMKEFDYMKQNGLAKGASFENTLIFTETGSTLAPARFDHEAIYHKILDLIGDLALLGVPLQFHIIGSKGGHGLDIALAHKLRSTIIKQKTKEKKIKVS